MKNAELDIFEYGYWLYSEVAPHFSVCLLTNIELLKNNIV